MEDIIIYGAGGFGREVHVLIKQINKVFLQYRILGFIDDAPLLNGKTINGVPVLGGLEYLLTTERSAVVAVALLGLHKEQLVKKIRLNNHLKFANLVHPDIYWDETNAIGTGNILCHGMNMTCNIKIGDFNVFNGRVGIGHDVKIGDFNLFGPNSFIAGEVQIGDNNKFAMNSSVLQQKKIGDSNIINMNSVLIRNIGNDGVYFGVPALKQKF